MGNGYWRGRGNGRWDPDGWWDMHDRMRYGYGYGDGMGWAGWLLTILFVLLLLAAIAALVLFIVRSSRGAGSLGTRRTTAGAAHQVLDERFARGEIDEEEYLRRRAVLRGDQAAAT